MNEKRRFTCKMENVPAVAGYLTQRLRADLVDFVEFSDMFSEDYLKQFVAKTTQCSLLVSSDVLTKEVGTITSQIGDKLKRLRLLSNKLEVYLDMADGQMTVSAGSFALKQVRDAMETGGSEGIVAQIRRLLVMLNSNQAVLLTKGLKPDLIDELKQMADQLEIQGNDQNFKLTERNRHTDINVGLYNELWDMVLFITDTGKALYRGVDATKVDDYTIASILRRIGTSKGKTDTPETPKA